MFPPTEFNLDLTNFATQLRDANAIQTEFFCYKSGGPPLFRGIIRPSSWCEFEQCYRNLAADEEC